jgi:hypothetical protein
MIVARRESERGGGGGDGAGAGGRTGGAGGRCAVTLRAGVQDSFGLADDVELLRSESAHAEDDDPPSRLVAG